MFGREYLVPTFIDVACIDIVHLHDCKIEFAIFLCHIFPIVFLVCIAYIQSTAICGLSASLCIAHD